MWCDKFYLKSFAIYFVANGALTTKLFAIKVCYSRVSARVTRQDRPGAGVDEENGGKAEDGVKGAIPFGIGRYTLSFSLAGFIVRQSIRQQRG